MRRWLLWAAAFLGVACGGGSGGGGTVGTTSTGTTLTATGTLAFTAGNAASVSGSKTCQVDGITYYQAFRVVVASDQSGICGYLQRSQNKAGARSIQIVVFRADPTHSDTAVTPGTYQVVPDVRNATTQSSFALAQIIQNDATCARSGFAATGGTVQITSTTGGQLMGTVNVTLSDGGAITGSFAADDCAVVSQRDVCSFELGPANPTCVP